MHLHRTELSSPGYLTKEAVAYRHFGSKRGLGGPASTRTPDNANPCPVAAPGWSKAQPRVRWVGPTNFRMTGVAPFGALVGPHNGDRSESVDQNSVETNPGSPGDSASPAVSYFLAL